MRQSQVWDSYQRPRDCAVQSSEATRLRFFDSWFDMSWPLASLSSSTPATMQFQLCLSWTPCHANRTDATVEVVVARFQNYPKLFFQSVPYIGPIWDQISTAKEALQELQVWDSYQGPWSKTLRWTNSLQCKTVKLRSCKYHWVATSLSKYLQLCVLLASLFWLLLAVSQSPVFWLLIWLSMANGSFLKFNANTSPHAVQW